MQTMQTSDTRPRKPHPRPNMTSIGITSRGKNQFNTRSTIEIGVRQSEQPLSIAETVSTVAAEPRVAASHRGPTRPDLRYT